MTGTSLLLCMSGMTGTIDMRRVPKKRVMASMTGMPGLLGMSGMNVMNCMLRMPGFSGRNEMLRMPGPPQIPEFPVMIGIPGMS